MSESLLVALKHLTDSTSLARGVAYANAGRVMSWQVAPDQKTMTATVRGTSRYRLKVEFTWSALGGLSGFWGHCSCPMGFNCKHVVAAILVADAAGALITASSQSPAWNGPHHGVGLSNQQPTHLQSTAPPLTVTGSSHASGAPMPPPLDRELERWLTQYENQQLNRHRGHRAEANPNQYALTVKDRIRYVVNQTRSSVTIDAVKVSVRKDGSLSASTPRRYDFSNVNQDSPPRFVLPIDLRIFRLLSLSRQGFYGFSTTIADDEEGQTLFRLVLESGRAYWGDVYGLPLELDTPSIGRFSWRDFGETQQLMVKVDGKDQAKDQKTQADTDQGDANPQNSETVSEDGWRVALPLMPAWCLDVVTGKCGPLQTDYSPQQLKWLASAPLVPATQTDQVLAAMSQANIDLPRPKPVAQQWITDLKPVAVLTLGAIKARRRQFQFYRTYQIEFQPHEIAPMLRLSFDYAGHRITSDTAEANIRQVVNGQLQVIERHRESEVALLDALIDQGLEYGFHPVNYHDGTSDMAGFKPNDLVLWPFDHTNPLSPEGGGHEALDFMEEVVPALTAQGWKVIIDPSWPCPVFEGTPQINGGIKQQEDSWFSVGLNYEVQGQEFDLLPVLATLVESIPESVFENEQELNDTLAGKRFVARLKDGRYARLPIEPLIPALRFIRDLNQRMHAAQAGTISDFAQALAGCGIPFTGGQQLQELGARLRDLAKCHANFSVDSHSSEWPVVSHHFKGDLRPYQLTGMAWMLALSDTGFGGILADDMGLGKTVQTLAFIASRKQSSEQATEQAIQSGSDHQPPQRLPYLLVVPTSLVSNWSREAARFVPGLTVLSLHGPDRKQSFDQIAQHDLVITTYPLLHRDSEILFAQEYDTVILDEAQHVKNPASQVAKLIRQINARQRLALTGTPMENNLEELWCLFDWLIPGLLGNRKSFADQFRKPIEKEKNLNRQVVLSKRIAPFIMRRTKDQVATDLPPRTEIIETVQLTGPQRALYETVRSTMHERVRKALAQKGLASSKITVLDALLKLRQACCDPQLVKLASAASITASAKRSRLMEMLESLIAEGRRVLVFSQFVEMLRLIESDVKVRGWDYLMLTGQTQKRGELVEAFQSGKASLFLISLKAGGVGLNLTAADTVILYDPWWNPAIERQAMDRVHRIGQDKPVFVHRLIAEGTVETRIAEMQARKQALMDSVFDPESTSTVDMSEAEILSLFAPGGH